MCPERFAEVAQIPLPLLKGAHFAEVLEMLCPDDEIAASNIAGADGARRAPLHEMNFKRRRRRRGAAVVVHGQAQPRR